MYDNLQPPKTTLSSLGLTEAAGNTGATAVTAELDLMVLRQLGQVSRRYLTYYLLWLVITNS